jgi:hypothetical protein
LSIGDAHGRSTLHEDAGQRGTDEAGATEQSEGQFIPEVRERAAGTP